MFSDNDLKQIFDILSTGSDSDADSMAVVNKPTTFTFHNAATEAAAGEIFECIGEYKKARVVIDRTDVTANQIDFLQSIDGVDYFPLLGATVDSNALVSKGVVSTSTSDSLWEFDIEGVKYIKMNLTSITGTSVTVKAVVV